MTAPPKGKEAGATPLSPELRMALAQMKVESQVIRATADRMQRAIESAERASVAPAGRQALAPTKEDS